MKVLITENVQTDLDMTNGGGEIVQIILDPDEPPIGDKTEVRLQHPPAYVLVDASIHTRRFRTLCYTTGNDDNKT